MLRGMLPPRWCKPDSTSITRRGLIDGIQELLEEGMKLSVVFPDGVGFFTKEFGWTRVI